MVPVRTCIGCRRRSEQDDVVRFALQGGQVRPDPVRRIPGRGAWLHLDRACFEAALKRKAFNRAFRTAVSTEGLDFDDVAAEVSTDKRAGLKE